jgi:hypothetical protein
LYSDFGHERACAMCEGSGSVREFDMLERLKREGASLASSSKFMPYA